MTPFILSVESLKKQKRKEKWSHNLFNWILLRSSSESISLKCNLATNAASRIRREIFLGGLEKPAIAGDDDEFINGAAAGIVNNVEDKAEGVIEDLLPLWVWDNSTG